MIENLTCFKCHEHFATLTYCENRMYRVSCPCGCEYSFEHSSMKCAEKYHLREVELHGEIDAHRRTKADLTRTTVQLRKAMELLKSAIADIGGVCSADVCGFCENVYHCGEREQSYCGNVNFRRQHADRCEALKAKESKDL